MESRETNDEKRPVRGPVRTFSTEWSYRVFDEGEWAEESRGEADSGWVFDGDGRVLEAPATDYVEPGDPARFVYTYDEVGRRRRGDGFDDDGSHIERVDIEYPSEGGAVRTTFYTGETTSEPLLTSRLWYDSDGRLVELRDYLPDGAVSSRTLSRFERDGSALVEKTYRFGAHREGWSNREFPRVTVDDPVFGEGVLRDVTRSRFDAEGRPVEERVYLPGGSLWARTVDVYGPRGSKARYHYAYDHLTGLLSQISLDFDDHAGDAIEKIVVDGEADVALLYEDGQEAELERHPASFDRVRGLRISRVAEGRPHADTYRRGEHDLFERVSTRVTDPSGAATEAATCDRDGPLDSHQRVRRLSYDSFGNWTSDVTDFRNIGYWSRASRRRTFTYF